jgi:hypothetical protein
MGKLGAMMTQLLLRRLRQEGPLSPGVGGHLGQHSKTPSLKKKKDKGAGGIAQW